MQERSRSKGRDKSARAARPDAKEPPCPKHKKTTVPASPPQSPEGGALFQVLTSRKAIPEQVYAAIREVETMAGQSVVAQLTALIQTTAAEQNAQFQTLNTRLASVDKQLGRIWTFLFLILGTLLGTLATLLTTLLLRS